jgi:hypothetical protein
MNALLPDGVTLTASPGASESQRKAWALSVVKSRIRPAVSFMRAMFIPSANQSENAYIQIM